MKTKHLLALVFLIACLIGITVTTAIVRTEGWEGLWNRKKTWIETTVPGSEPALKKAEEALPNMKKAPDTRG